MRAAAALHPSSHATALVARIPLVVARRAFHASADRNRAVDAGGKPATEDVATEHGADAEPQAGTDTFGGRNRSQAAGASRSRQTRRHVASALPPVQLPRSFLEKRVFRLSRGPPQLAEALAEDARHDKVSRLYRHRSPEAQEHFYPHLGNYFAKVLLYLVEERNKIVEQSSKGGLSPKVIETLLRLGNMILDSAWHLVDAIYPCREAEYTYKVRPFWWWAVYRDLDRYEPNLSPDKPIIPEMSRHLKLQANPVFQYPPAHAVADFPEDSHLLLISTLWHDICLSPPPNLDDSRMIRRPISVLSLSGYGGKAISEAIGKSIAFSISADLIQLDAYDLSVLIGDYLGQNWAYSRGAVSMLGFRAAELNGKLCQELDPPGRHDETEDSDSEPVGTIRTSSGTLEEELQKIKHGNLEIFTKWESLKIDKILDHIIHSVGLKSVSTRPPRLLIQVDDFVELGMTLEGTLIINRLRALVDAAWQQGIQIAILGTSSCEQPSDEYQNAVRELAAGDFVITRNIRPDQVDRETAPTRGQPTFDLQKADYVAENMNNLMRMLEAIDAQSTRQLSESEADMVRAHLASRKPPNSACRGDILPAPEVYHLACAFQPAGMAGTPNISRQYLRLLTSTPLRPRQEPPRQMEERREEKKVDTVEKMQAEVRNSKLNEYERRIATGHINRENIKTTFADIHVPRDTISTLKLLTSLTLVRPDAFSYGVLAQDRIPGCLLYGPPGTGKTMLAKAVAKESGANMLEISGASINDKWVGESEKLIHAIFTLAKRLSPCVVFIDEADSILASRSMMSGRGARRELINQFLREWDGMEKTNAFIMVATNRPFDLDDAVLRRLPRRILVDLPLRDDRAAIMKLLLEGETLDSSVSIADYAARTTHYSGSDLKNVCVAAAMLAVEEENEAAARHEGPEPYRHPERRTLRGAHFERALAQIPASISENMDSLKMIRKFDTEYGNGRKGAKTRTMGFGVVDHRDPAAAGEVSVRPGSKR